MQEAVKRLERTQALYIQAQVAIVPLILLNWTLLAQNTRAFAFMMRPLAHAAVPLAELAVLLGTVAVLLGVGIHTLVGPRTKLWSSLMSTAARMGEHVFIGAPLTPGASPKPEIR